MKAILLNGFGGAEMMVFGDAERPLVGDGKILIKVAATSVNRPDVMQRQGNYAPPKGESEILGLEVAGTVEALGRFLLPAKSALPPSALASCVALPPPSMAASLAVGDKVTQWKIGERVMALIGGGGYAEYAVAHADHAMPIPESMDFNQAACVCETYLTAYLNLFMLGELQNRQSVLLHGGGGGVNTAAIQLCKALTPDSTIMVTASSGKVARVKKIIGARGVVIDYQLESFAERVKEITDQRGADVILDHIGGAYLKPNMQCLAVGGTLMLIGVMGGGVAELNLARAMVKRQRIIGSVLRSRPRAEKAALIAAFAKTVLPLMANGKIAPVISAVYPLAKAAAAHRAMEESSHFGKIVLAVT